MIPQSTVIRNSSPVCKSRLFPVEKGKFEIGPALHIHWFAQLKLLKFSFDLI